MVVVAAFRSACWPLGQSRCSRCLCIRWLSVWLSRSDRRVGVATLSNAVVRVLWPARILPRSVPAKKHRSACPCPRALVACTIPCLALEIPCVRTVCTVPSVARRIWSASPHAPQGSLGAPGVRGSPCHQMCLSCPPLESGESCLPTPCCAFLCPCSRVLARLCIRMPVSQGTEALWSDVALISGPVVLLALHSVAYPLVVTASPWITFWKFMHVDFRQTQLSSVPSAGAGWPVGIWCPPYRFHVRPRAEKRGGGLRLGPGVRLALPCNALACLGGVLGTISQLVLWIRQGRGLSSVTVPEAEGLLPAPGRRHGLLVPASRSASVRGASPRSGGNPRALR